LAIEVSSRGKIVLPLARLADRMSHIASIDRTMGLTGAHPLAAVDVARRRAPGQAPFNMNQAANGAPS
jgi:hypothetical protein